MRALVTGGAGFIGGHVVNLLCEQGHEVTVLDNLSTGHRRNLSEEIKLVQGDVRDGKLVGEVMEISGEVMDIVRAHIDGTGSASSERVVFLREGGSAGAENKLPQLPQSTRACESGWVGRCWCMRGVCCGSWRKCM